MGMAEAKSPGKSFGGISGHPSVFQEDEDGITARDSLKHYNQSISSN